MCSNRLLVQAGVFDAFTEKLVNSVKALKVGVGTDEDVAIGPLIDQQAANGLTGRQIALSSELNQPH